MAGELREALKSSAERIAKYVEDVAEMAVETHYVEVGAASFDQAKLAARTVVKLDGDSQTVIPMQKGEAKLEVDMGLFDVHQQNVQAAIDYRTKMMNALRRCCAAASPLRSTRIGALQKRQPLTQWRKTAKRKGLSALSLCAGVTNWARRLATRTPKGSNARVSRSQPCVPAAVA
jgi:hypothetical protein